MNHFKNLINKFRSEPKNRCGVNNFQCGKCQTCVIADNERWNKIWEQKYSQQEKEYYRPDSSSRESPSAMQSSLAINWPIDDMDYCLLSPERAEAGRRRAAGRRAKLRSKKNAAQSPA